MGRRAILPPAPPSPYKYTGSKDEGIRPHEQCEMSEPDSKHQVTPKSWPPARLGHQVGDPSVSLRCDLCGVNLVVYEKHATGEMDGVRVILPPAKEKKTA